MKPKEPIDQVVLALRDLLRAAQNFGVLEGARRPGDADRHEEALQQLRACAVEYRESLLPLGPLAREWELMIERMSMEHGKQIRVCYLRSEDSPIDPQTAN